MHDNHPVGKIGHLQATVVGTVDYTLCICKETKLLKGQ